MDMGRERALALLVELPGARASAFGQKRTFNPEIMPIREAPSA